MEELNVGAHCPPQTLKSISQQTSNYTIFNIYMKSNCTRKHHNQHGALSTGPT
jgi:hypothetical protein